MESTTYKLIEAVNQEGISNGIWGLCKGVNSTRDYFGTVEDIKLDGQYLYIYREDGEYFSFIKEETCGKPAYTLSVAGNEFIDIYKL